MKKCRIASVAFLIATLSCYSFVPTLTNPGNNQRRWNLVTLPASVQTNVVNRNTRAVRYFLASDGWSSTNTAAELNAVRASFAQWQAIPGTILKFEDGGLVSPPVDVNTSDGTNIVYWTKNGTVVNGGLSDISGALGVAFTSFFSDGTLAQGDIVLNGFNYAWFADFADPTNANQYVESTALHEIGHFIGLNHSPVGGATLMYTGNAGIDSEAGLSSDEFCAARFIYPQTNQPGLRGTLRGQVLRNGVGILGAVVIAEDASGTLIAGTVTRSGGNYELSALTPGNYQVRATPLDSLSAARSLLQGPDIGSEFNSAETRFLPTTNITVTLQAGITNTLNIPVMDAEPRFRITDIRGATLNASSFSWASLPTRVRPGQSNLTVGVASPSLPTNNATLTITGDGITQAATTFVTNAFGTGLNFISARIGISSNATPGLRSFIVQQGTNLAYANGFLDLLPNQPDYNFDALDDNYQRRYFQLFTSAPAAPNMDPDGDGFTNAAEYTAATNPTNAASLLKIDQVQHSATGSTVICESVAGKRYQLYSRLVVESGPWQPVGNPLSATGTTISLPDPDGISGARFYRVEVLP